MTGIDQRAFVVALRDPESRSAALATIDGLTDVGTLHNVCDALMPDWSHPALGLDAAKLRAMIRHTLEPVRPAGHSSSTCVHCAEARRRFPRDPARQAAWRLIYCHRGEDR